MRRASILILCGLCLIPSAGSHTYTVNPDGTGDFPTIQDAVDNVSDGDVIELTNGIFTGDGNRDIDYLGKAITIGSRNGNPSYCIIDCEGTETDPHRGFYFRSGEGLGSILEGITLRHGYVLGDDCGGAVVCCEGSPLIRDCILWGNRAWCGGAVHCAWASPEISQCQFLLNNAEYGGAFISCWESSATLIDCRFGHNAADIGGAIDM